MKKFLYIGIGAVLLLFLGLVAIGGGDNSLNTIPTEDLASLQKTEGMNQKPSVLPSAETIPQGKTENSTLLMGKTIAQELFQKNLDGPTLSEGRSRITAQDPQTLIDEILEQELENINGEDFRPIIRVDELKVVSATPENSEKFKKEFEEALAPFLAMTIDATNSPRTSFVPVAAAAEDALNALLELSVPSDVAVKFTKELELIAAHKNIFSAVANMEEDPFRALVAMQMWPPTREEFRVTHINFMETLTNS